MAKKNLLSSRWADEEVLHTEAEWIAHKHFDLNLDMALDTASAIAECEARERAVYNEYGSVNHRDFITRIRNRFMETPQDAEVLRQFEPINFQRHLANLALVGAAKKPYTPQKRDIIIKIDAKKASKELIKIFKQMTVLSEDNGSLTVQVGLDSTELARAVNRFKKDLSKKQKSGHYTGGNLTDKKMQELMKMSKSGFMSISLGSGNNTDLKDYYETTFQEEDILSRTSKNFPWGFKRKDIEFALRQDKSGKVRAQLEEAYKLLRQFFVETLPAKGSSKMKRAVLTVWSEKLGNSVDESIGFFEKGKNNDLKIGAAGEFAGAILLQYLAYSLGSVRKAHDIVKISGDDPSKLGVQGKADLMLFKKYGIQVKNFALAYRTKKGSIIDTNTSFYRIAEQCGPDAQDIKIFFANYFFNKDFQDKRAAEYQHFCENLSDYMYLVYAFAVNDYINEDTVNFYLIGGRYLVPSSVILRSLEQRKQKPSITINPPTEAKTSTELKELHEDYWIRTEDGGWRVEENGPNRQHFDNIIGKSVNSRTVSIRSDIDYSLFLNHLEQGEYGLW